MKKQFLKVIGGLLIGLTFFSCSKETIEKEEINYSSSDETYLWLLEQGFDEKDIQVFENHFIVENDMLVEKKYIDSETELKSSNSSAQRINSQTPRDSNVPLQIMDDTEVSFYIYPDMPQEFINASVLAIERWNEVLNNMELIITTNKDDASTEILLDSQEIDSRYTYVYPLESFNGLALLGSGSGPGKKIWINEAYNYGVSSLCFGEQITNEEKLTGTIQHEIGHVLAFLHTDSWDGLHVEGSMKTRSLSDDSVGEEDTRSVMLSGSCSNDFSEGDIKSIENIYGMPEHGVQYKNYSLEYAVVDKLITYPNTNSDTFYSGNGSTDIDSGSYFNRKYFDGSFNVCWNTNILESVNFVRVKLSVGVNTSAEEIVYDRWIYKYNTLDNVEYSSEFGVTIPKEYYLNNRRTGISRIDVYYGSSGYKDEAEVVVFSVDN